MHSMNKPRHPVSRQTKWKRGQDVGRLRKRVDHLRVPLSIGYDEVQRKFIVAEPTGHSFTGSFPVVSAFLEGYGRAVVALGK